MKCPKCGGRLVYWGATGALLKCEQCKFGWGNEELWQELIRTRKALEMAVDELKEINKLLSSNKFDVREVPLLNITQTKISMLLKCINIEQITALEQKE